MTSLNCLMMLTCVSRKGLQLKKALAFCSVTREIRSVSCPAGGATIAMLSHIAAAASRPAAKLNRSRCWTHYRDRAMHVAAKTSARRQQVVEIILNRNFTAGGWTNGYCARFGTWRSAFRISVLYIWHMGFSVSSLGNVLTHWCAGHPSRVDALVLASVGVEVLGATTGAAHG